MEYNAESPSRAKYLDIARAMGVDTAGMSVDESVAAAVGAVRDLSLSIGIPQRLHRDRREGGGHPRAGRGGVQRCLHGRQPASDLGRGYRKTIPYRILKQRP